MSDVDYLVCQNCDTPCYVFELDPKGEKVVSAYCLVCGNDNDEEFKIPDLEDMEPDE